MKVFAVLLLIVGLGQGLHSQAQTLEVKFDSDSKQLLAGEQLVTVINVTPPSNFQASIFLSIRSSLPISNNNLSTTILNAPYPATAVLTYNTSLLDSGSQYIIIEAKNGQISALDTLRLQIGKSEQWRKLPAIYNGINNFYFDEKNELHFFDQKITKIVSGERISIPAWDNMQGNIHTLLIDKQQNIWTSTYTGISKYDGQYWTTYPRTDFIKASKMVMDMNGSLWFSGLNSSGHFTDYSMYLLKNGSIERIDSIRKLIPGLLKQKSTFRIYDLCSDSKGNIFALTCAQSDSLEQPVILKYDGNSWSTINYPNIGKTNIEYVSDWMRVTTDNQNNLWFYYDVIDSFKQNANGLLKYDGTSWLDFKSQTDLRVQGEGAPFQTGIYADKVGNIWFASYSQSYSLVQFNGTNFIIYNSTNSPLPFNTPTAVGIDSNNNIWMKCDTNTIVYNPNGIIGVKAATSIADNLNYFEAFKTIASPNPTQSSTTIYYSLKTESPIFISIYNSLGIEVFKNNLGFKNTGENSEIISISELPSGQYYYVLKAGAQQSTQPLVIVR